MRATVRAGRDRMRSTLLSWLPQDLRGRRILDAGCGTGALAVEAARRGADVVAIDLVADAGRPGARTPARRRWAAAASTSAAATCSTPMLGQFDHVVAMDSLIHYRAADVVARCRSWPRAPPLDRSSPPRRARRRTLRCCGVGRLFPRGDRSPAIEPVAPSAAAAPDGAEADAGRTGSRPLRRRITGGFYKSQALEWTRLVKTPPLLTPAQQAALQRLLPRLLPFADAASADLPLPRLLRLSLFQVSVGLAAALLVGTLNRVMIVELHMAAWLVALMVALPLLVAPFRALVGFRSDTHASAIGWRRVPYVWIGTMLQFGGLAIMPFALLVLTGDGQLGLAWLGQLCAGLAFLLVGAGPADHADRRPGAGHRPGQPERPGRAWWR